MTVRVSIRVPVGHPIPELAEFARACEGAGMAGVGINDHHHSGRDAYVALALAAARTERLTLFPVTTNPVTRHPLVLASSVNALAEIAPGRILLTMAPGFLSVEKVGRPRAQRAQLGQAVRTIRELLSGRSSTFEGYELRMNNPVQPSPEVYVLASGPKMLELAGEVADGVFMLAGLHRDSIAAARAHVRAGAERAGRAPDAVREILIVPTAIEDFDTAREWPRTWFRPGKTFLTYPSASNLHWLRVAGIDLPDNLDPATMSPSLAARICDAFGLFGPPEYCADRLIQAAEESGIEYVYFFPSHSAETAYDLPAGDVTAFATVIGPRLASA